MPDLTAGWVVFHNLLKQARRLNAFRENRKCHDCGLDLLDADEESLVRCSVSIVAARASSVSPLTSLELCAPIA